MDIRDCFQNVEITRARQFPLQYSVRMRVLSESNIIVLLGRKAIQGTFTLLPDYALDTPIRHGRLHCINCGDFRRRW